MDKAVYVGRERRITLMLDIYNLFNSTAVTNFSLRTGDDKRVIAALDPIAMKLGVRSSSDRHGMDRPSTSWKS